jgi:hypothetical protein
VRTTHTRVTLPPSNASDGGFGMGDFEDAHCDRIVGSLAMFDRLIFKGRLTAFYRARPRRPTV